MAWFGIAITASQPEELVVYSLSSRVASRHLPLIPLAAPRSIAVRGGTP